MSKIMKIVIKDKHKFGVIESDLHFEAAIKTKQRLMTKINDHPTTFFIYKKLTRVETKRRRTFTPIFRVIVHLLATSCYYGKRLTSLGRYKATI